MKGDTFHALCKSCVPKIKKEGENYDFRFY